MPVLRFFLFLVSESYTRDTNGIHDVAMVSCECRGPDNLPFELLAARLLPTSFNWIKTLFTAQLLDRFRLSNLELKVSAYQFYQLLCCLTQPTAPAEVADLYREFRRMSRIWCWMKRLKWAGYGFPIEMWQRSKKVNSQSFVQHVHNPASTYPTIGRKTQPGKLNMFCLLPYSIQNPDGFINEFLLLMEISKPIMSGKRILPEMYVFLQGVEWSRRCKNTWPFCVMQ